MSEHEGNTTPAETQEKVSEKIKKKGRKEVAKKNKVLESLDIQYINVNDIHPNEWNPNRQSEHDFELLLKSMREDGFTQPVVAIKTDEGLIKIVDGEHRWRAAHTLGFEDIPVVITPMTEEQAKIATLRHNRARGSEDVDLTAELLRDLEKLGALDWAQDSLMMDDTEIQKMLEDIPAPEALAADEYTEAWEPGEMSGAQEDAGTSTREIQGASGVTVAAASIASIERQRERERQIAEAKTAEERQALKKDNDIFRLYLTFTGDEATLVKQILGEQAAEKLIEMCKREEAELAEEDA
jgi:ParB-like chromosome segregation protein Spo0J|tara:strand:+ start:205 stop:1095 length:891 start_codon:yes stop_codon:yes gene_type:complete